MEPFRSNQRSRRPARTEEVSRRDLESLGEECGCDGCGWMTAGFSWVHLGVLKLLELVTSPKSTSKDIRLDQNPGWNLGVSISQ